MRRRGLSDHCRETANTLSVCRVSPVKLLDHEEAQRLRPSRRSQFYGSGVYGCRDTTTTVVLADLPSERPQHHLRHLLAGVGLVSQAESSQNRAWACCSPGVFTLQRVKDGPQDVVHIVVTAAGHTETKRLAPVFGHPYFLLAGSKTFNLGRPTGQRGDVVGKASRPVAAGETAIHQRQAGEVLLKREVPELKDRDRPSTVADVTGFYQDTRAPLQQAQECLGRVSSYRVDLGIFLPHALEQTDDFVLPKLLHSAIAHLVGNVLKLRNRLIAVNWLVHLAAPVEQHLHPLPVQIGPVAGELADFALDQCQCRQQHWVASETLNAVGAVNVVNQLLRRPIPPLWRFGDSAPAAGEIVFVLL